MLILSIILMLLSNAVNIRRDLSIIYNRVTIIILILSILLDITSLFIANNDISLHGGLLCTTVIIQIFHIFIFLITILILQLTSFYPKNFIKDAEEFHNTSINIIKYENKLFKNVEDHLKILEYPLIILFIIIGAIFLISSNDFISIFLSIELQSYGLYLLSTIYRDSELSTIGGLMYFLLGSLSSCFILLGISLIYINTGTTNLDNLYIINNISNYNNENLLYKPYYIDYSLLIFIIGFLFKISAAPFHFWSPDVYDSIPTIVTTFVAIIAKISIFILLLQLVYYLNDDKSEINWIYSLIISSFLSLIIGTIVGLTQFRIKRLFAYSTISHVGFMLLALSIFSVESLQAFIFYLTQYTISNLNAFFILIAIGFYLHFYNNGNKEHQELRDKNNSPIQLINQLKGFFYINPFLALSLSITIFSFAGIPPFIGFFAKQMVLSSALDKGFIIMSLIAIITSVIGAVYYLNIIKEMFFYSSNYKHNNLFKNITELGYIFNNEKKKLFIMKDIIFLMQDNYNKTTISSSISFTISFITLILLLFILGNKEWLSMGTLLVQILFNN